VTSRVVVPSAPTHPTPEASVPPPVPAAPLAPAPPLAAPAGEPVADTKGSSARDAAADAAGIFPPYLEHADDAEPVSEPIQGLERLDYYFGQLTLTELKRAGAITRASHWGDSVLGGDGLTSVIRQKLQARFGDAGHGFHALNRYHIGYRHRGIEQRDRKTWDSCEIIFKCRPEKRYGYGGISTASPGGGWSAFETVKEPPGDKVARFELWYVKHPEGGRFQVKVDSKVERVIQTRSKDWVDAVETVQVEDGPHEFEVSALGGGTARGYGVVLERDVPGVVWDELSLIGSFTQRLDYQDPEHIKGQVARRDVDLLVFILGGNDVQRGTTDLKKDMSRYEAEYTRVLRKYRAGKPQASCLIMTPIDHGERVGNSIRSRPVMSRLVAAQHKVADEQGCAFYDTWRAMGGEGSIGRWYQARPQLAAKDLVHPSVRGQATIASMLYHALMKGYAEYRQRRVGEPLPALDRAPVSAESSEVARN
jgi:lysophospholipase L1-like esterase